MRDSNSHNDQNPAQEVSFLDRLRQPISLRRQITLLFFALFCVVQIGLIAANYLTSKSTVTDRMNKELDQSILSFDHIIKDQLNHLYLQADLLSKDFGFKGAMATEESETILSALKNIQTRGDADLALALNVDGDLIAVAGGGERFELPGNFNLAGMIETIESEQEIPHFFSNGDQQYEMAIVPVRAPVLVGYIAFAKALDDKQAKLIQSFSSLSVGVAFVHQQDTWVISGKSADDKFIEYYMQMRSLNDTTAGQSQIEHMGESFAVRFLPLSRDAGANNRYLLLFTSLDKAMGDYMTLFIAMIVVGVFGLGLLFVGSYIVSTRISAPIKKLAFVAKDISEGNYHALATPEGYKEVNLLSNSFNSMVQAIKDREAQITYAACHDNESDLPNTQYFTQQVERALETEDSFALIVAEVSNYQDLRVVLEHAQMTQLIKQTGERLHKLTGVEVARTSTDSLGFLVNNVEMAHTLIKGILDAFLTPVIVDEVKIDVIVNLGMVVCPDDGRDAQTLILNSHSALDQARNRGINFVRYKENHKASHENNLSLMSDFREEVTHGHVNFAFQPKLDIATNKIYGAEALIRWNSPKHGFVPPDKFIPMAERTGDITHLTAWAVGKIIAQSSKFTKLDMPLLVAINLSTRDLQNENLPDLLQLVTAEHGVAPSSICLEVTESAIMGDMKRALSILNRLSDMGYYLSIDDYGTGYSSLAYIKKLPVNELKIDKAFVMNLANSPEDQILVQSTIDLAHNLGMKVTAEGVEDIPSLNLLREYGCDIAQGYHVARPLAVEDFKAFWINHNAE